MWPSIPARISVTVALTRSAGAIELVIADDGKGFDLAAARGRRAGLGLVSVDERVRLLHGQVHIDTQPGRGTRVDVRIPSSPATPSLHEFTSVVAVGSSRALS